MCPLLHLQGDRRLANAEVLPADVDAALESVFASNHRWHKCQPVALAAVLRLLGKDILARLARVLPLANESIDGKVAIEVERVHVREHSGHRCLHLKVERGAVKHLHTLLACVGGVRGRDRQSAELVVGSGAAGAGVAARGADGLIKHANLHAVVTSNVRRIGKGVRAVVVVLPIPEEVLGAVELQGPVSDASGGAQVAVHVHRLELELHRHPGHGLLHLIQVKCVLCVVNVRHVRVSDVWVHVGGGLVDLALAVGARDDCVVAGAIADLDLVIARHVAREGGNVGAVHHVHNAVADGEQDGLRVKVQRARDLHHVGVATHMPLVAALIKGLDGHHGALAGDGLLKRGAHHLRGPDKGGLAIGPNFEPNNEGLVVEVEVGVGLGQVGC
mmetsp:Transcript_28272/g.47431  ORF Transcript_28272/g.47431 Transcript_28272/m.47431 type:complete len:388 (-) Transcript_28272:3259-4422(-)